MSNMSILKHRLDLLGITDDTKNNIKLFYPCIWQDIDKIIDRFYSYIVTFPEGEQLLVDKSVINKLKVKQREHWLRLFSCKFDEEYMDSAVRIGQVHFEKKVAPYLYLAGYNFIHCGIIHLASKTYSSETDLAALLTATNRVITLDMDLALSAYTREYWRGSETP